MCRFYNFTSVKLVRIGTGAAWISRVTRQAVDYVDAAGTSKSVDLMECAQTFFCLRSAGLFPPSDDLDWGKLASFYDYDLTETCYIGLRGVLDRPPWFQFLNRRRTQFEFAEHLDIYEELLGPLSRAGWRTFDAC
jgi:hypothetical protein